MQFIQFIQFILFFSPIVVVVNSNFLTLTCLAESPLDKAP